MTLDGLAEKQEDDERGEVEDGPSQIETSTVTIQTMLYKWLQYHP